MTPRMTSPYLLEVCCKAVHVLIVGQKRMGLSPKAVDIPDPQHCQQHGHVLLQRSGAEVIVLLGKWM